jgi:prepilin-type processing-associated H-X9-DG protein
MAALIVAAFGLPLVAALPPLFHFESDPPAHGSCESNEKQLANALRMYMSDYDGQFPAAAAWQDLTYPYVKNEIPYRCWARPRVNPGYAFNQALDGHADIDIQAPKSTPLFHESRIGKRNAADRLESFVKPHRGYGIVVFADGHTRALNAAPAAVPQPGSQAP